MPETRPWIALMRLRWDAGYTKTVCASKAGLSRNYYSEIELGRRRGTPPTIKKIAGVFGMTVSELEDTRTSDTEQVA